MNISLGRIVHYHKSADVTCPAICTGTAPDGKVNLTVFPPNEMPYPVVAEERDDDNFIERWVWPTYENVPQAPPPAHEPPPAATGIGSVESAAAVPIPGSPRDLYTVPTAADVAQAPST